MKRDDEMYWYNRERDPAFLESIADARRQVREGRTISLTDLKRELGIDDRGESMTLDRILDLLDRFHQRATYAAVAGVVNGSPRAVMQGRPQDPRHSWVVAKKTGQPTGYPQGRKHVDLGDREHVIDDPEGLRRWLQSPR